MLLTVLFCRVLLLVSIVSLIITIAGIIAFVNSDDKNSKKSIRATTIIALVSTIFAGCIAFSHDRCGSCNSKFLHLKNQTYCTDCGYNLKAIYECSCGERYVNLKHDFCINCGKKTGLEH